MTARKASRPRKYLGARWNGMWHGVRDYPLVAHPDAVAPGLVLTSGLTEVKRLPFATITEDEHGTALLAWEGPDSLSDARVWLAEHGTALRELDWTIPTAEIKSSQSHSAFIEHWRARIPASPSWWAR